MRVFGKDVTTKKLLDVAKERLAARGLLPPSEAVELDEAAVEAPIEPFAFAVEMMSTHVDSTRGLPIETHRAGASGRAVVLAKQVFRKVGQLFINEALSRQVAFNAQTLDGFAALSAEVVRLRQRVAELEGRPTQALVPAPKAPPKKPSPKAPPATPKPKRAKR